MIDVVMPLGTGCDWKEHYELKYCIRSLEKNLQGLRNIYIVGHKPSWITNVIHIPADDPLPRNKDGNIINKILLACNTKELSDNFLRISDDQMILQPSGIEELQPNHSGCLSKIQKWRSSKWLRRLKRTYEYLKERNLPTYNYDIHIPFVVNKVQFKEVWNNVDFESDIGYCINTLFFNVSFPNMENISYIWDQKCTVEKNIYPKEKIYEMLDGKRFLGYNMYGLNDHLKIVIQELFPHKSKYEF